MYGFQVACIRGMYADLTLGAMFMLCIHMTDFNIFHYYI